MKMLVPIMSIVSEWSEMAARSDRAVDFRHEAPDRPGFQLCSLNCLRTFPPFPPSFFSGLRILFHSISGLARSVSQSVTQLRRPSLPDGRSLRPGGFVVKFRRACLRYQICLTKPETRGKISLPNYVARYRLLTRRPQVADRV